MNENYKYCKTSKTCLENADYGSIYCQLHKRIPKVIGKTYDELQQENQKLKQQLQQRDNIINKAREKCKNKGKMDYDVWLYLSETIKTLEGFSKHIDYNLHPIITEAYKCEVRNCINELCEVVKYKLIYKDELLEILDKGDE